MIANGYQHNYERLQTWQGKASIHSRNHASGSVSEDTHAVDFLCDVSNDKLRWYWRKLATGGTSDEKPNQAEYYAAGLVTGRTFWKLYPVQAGEPRPMANVHIGPRPTELTDVSEEFSPLYYFKCIERDMYTRLMFFYEHRDALKYLVRIEREGDVVVITLESKQAIAESDLVNRYTFDMGQGCNLIRYYAKGTVTADWSLAYEQVAGVYVPKSVRFLYEAPAGQLRYTKTTEFTLSVLNRPIDPNEFTLERLGLEPGDKIQDRISGLSYLYKTPAMSREDWNDLQGPAVEEDGAVGELDRAETGGGHVQAVVNEKNQRDHNTEMKAEPESITYWFVIILVVVVVFSCCVFVRKRRVRSQCAKAGL